MFGKNVKLIITYQTHDNRSLEANVFSIFTMKTRHKANHRVKEMNTKERQEKTKHPFLEDKNDNRPRNIM
jgi:hypothetical protein